MKPNARLLALSARRRKVGYAVFEGRRHLLDWGVRKWTPARGVLGGIDALIRFHAPASVVVRFAASKCESMTRVEVMNRLLQRQCAFWNIAFRRLPLSLLERHFAQYSCRTKDDIARLATTWFPELSWNLPRKRAAWSSEAHSVAAFEAVATGIAYLAEPIRNHESSGHKPFRRPLTDA